MPSEEDIRSFRKAKWAELKQQYSHRRKRREPFEYELDSIVLGCWSHAEEFGRKTVWKKYKESFD
jgi:hypothetical protein